MQPGFPGNDAMRKMRDEIRDGSQKRSEWHWFRRRVRGQYAPLSRGLLSCEGNERNSSCQEVPPDAFIREEEMKRSANKSQIDIDNGVVGSQAPANTSCASYCMKAYTDGRIKTEKPGPWPMPNP